MIDEELLALLACPETRQVLSVAPQDIVERLNAAIQQGKIINRAMRKVERGVEGLLVREDGKIGYPIWDSIPALLIEEGIPLDQVNT